MITAELGVGLGGVRAIDNELTKSSDDFSESVKKVLGLNSRQILVNLLTLGYEENPKETKKLRKDISEVVFYESL